MRSKTLILQTIKYSLSDRLKTVGRIFNLELEKYKTVANLSLYTCKDTVTLKHKLDYNNKVL